MEFDVYEKLLTAWEISTMRHNAFKEAIDGIKWDEIFEADEEIYFCKDGYTLTVQNIDPFKERWKPTFYTSDNYMFEF